MIARRRRPERSPYQLGCAVGAWLFLLAATAFAITVLAAHDRGDVVGGVAGIAVCLLGSHACASSARRG